MSESGVQGPHSHSVGDGDMAVEHLGMELPNCLHMGVEDGCTSSALVSATKRQGGEASSQFGCNLGEGAGKHGGM